MQLQFSCSDSCFDTCRDTIGLMESEAFIARTNALRIARVSSSKRARQKEKRSFYSTIHLVAFGLREILASGKSIGQNM